ncbi:hypothetical protein JHK85_023951 [Glycine max]|nr:hypothetical protein JHK85_023951 [Glycine max]
MPEIEIANKLCAVVDVAPKHDSFPIPGKGSITDISCIEGRSSVCDICGEPLKFLLQVFASTKKENAFHQMPVDFMCPSLKCLLRDQHDHISLVMLGSLRSCDGAEFLIRAGLFSYSDNFLDDFQLDRFDHMEPPASLSNFDFCGYNERYRPAGSGV